MAYTCQGRHCRDGAALLWLTMLTEGQERRHIAVGRPVERQMTTRMQLALILRLPIQQPPRPGAILGIAEVRD